MAIGDAGARTARLDRVPEDAAGLYLDLLKRTIVNWIYPEAETLGSASRAGGARGWVQKKLRKAGLAAPITRPFDPELRAIGRDWPRFAHSMLGFHRLDNIQHCVETALAEGVPGDLIEAGVWRGGGSILMRAVLAAHRIDDRRVWLADSFEGLPPPDADHFPADSGDRHHTRDALAVSLEQVQENFRRYGLLDDNVRFVKGWFKDTLQLVQAERFAVVRLDGDMYESTIQGLEALYPRLSPGGFLIVDDYGCLPQCRQAVDDYRKAQGIDEPIEEIDWTGVFWRRRGE